jgi:hypothetical protein
MAAAATAHSSSRCRPCRAGRAARTPHGGDGTGGNGDGAGTGRGNGASPRQQRSALRAANAKLLQDLVWATGMGHAHVNAQLNRLVGLRRIDEATIDQLRRRAQQAERWLAQL